MKSNKASSHGFDICFVLTDFAGKRLVIVLQVVDKLHGILKPFLLRRVKSDVENSLPGKKELILYANMTKTQTDFNEELRKNTLNVSQHTSSHAV